jgi:uncharacterized protein YjdB
MRSRFRSTVALVVTATSLLFAGVASASTATASYAGSVCYRAHVQNIGWQGWACNGEIAGTTGQSLRLEALDIARQDGGTICADAHVQDIGWQGWRCGTSVSVGTTGQSLRMEALTLSVDDTVCANAHVQDIGWQGWYCGNSVTVGTTGKSLRMEAIQIILP